MPVGQQVPDAEGRPAGCRGPERGEQHDLGVRNLERGVGAEITAGNGIGLGERPAPEERVAQHRRRRALRAEMPARGNGRIAEILQPVAGMVLQVAAHIRRIVDDRNPLR